MSKETSIPWAIGQKIYGLRMEYDVAKCGFCDGEKEIVGKNGATTECPLCWGTGEDLDFDHGKWIVEGPAEVTGFFVNRRQRLDKRSPIDVSLQTTFGNYMQADSFTKKADANAEAKRRNAAGIKPTPYEDDYDDLGIGLEDTDEG